MENPLKVDFHNNCCGVVHLGNFYTSVWNGKDYKYIKKEKALEFLEEIFKNCFRSSNARQTPKRIPRKFTCVNRELIPFRRGLLVEATLNRNQLKYWGEVLEEFGFVKVAEWKNPNSGNIVSMFTFTDWSRFDD